MKLFIITALSLVSSVAMADGFRCANDDFRVKLYNEVQPENGTRNPAVLVVSEKGVGTIATLDGSEIEKTITETSVIYKGTTNSKLDGRYVSVKLSVRKTPSAYAKYEGQHHGVLTINADGETVKQSVLCARYKKTDRE